MPTILERMNRLEADMEARLDTVQQFVWAECQAIVEAQLEDWANRFPRHTFKAWEGHGLLEFEVDPPVLGERFLNNLHRGERGAIGDLVEEVESFIDKWSAMERKTGSGLSGIVERRAPPSSGLMVRGYIDAAAGIKWYHNPFPSGSVEAGQWDEGHTRYRRLMETRSS